VTTEFGALLDGGFYIRYLAHNIFPFTFGKHFMPDFQYQFWTLGGDDLPNYPEQLGHYQQYSLGLNYFVFSIKPQFQILPYASTRLGYQVERIYAGTQPSPNYRVGSFNVILEGGLRLKFPTLNFDTNCFYGLTANYQYAISIANTKNHPTEPGYSFAQNRGGVSIGGFVMIDF
jgi:hypothetical protein